MSAFDSLLVSISVSVFLYLSKDLLLLFFFLGSGPDRGQGPVEWGEIYYIRPYDKEKQGKGVADHLMPLGDWFFNQVWLWIRRK